MYIIIIELISIVTVCAVIYLKWSLNYWSRKKFPFIKAKSLLFGSFENPASATDNFGMQLKNYYIYARRNKYQHFGVYLLWKPFYVPVEPEIVKNILIKNFDKFSNRGFFYNEKDEPLTAHLFHLNAEKWRPLRNKLTPTFTSGKMKMMFQTVLVCGEQLRQVVSKNVELDKPLKCKEVLGKFTMNVIGSSAFGIDCNTFENSDSEFVRHAKRIIVPDKVEILKNFFGLCFPNLIKTLKIKVMNRDVAEFFMRVVKETVKHREENEVVRNDFLHLLIQLKNCQNPLTMNEVAAQAFVIFLAGYETSSSTATFCLYELAYNQDIQTRVRDEVIKTIEKHDNQLTSECLNEMKYLDQVVDETLRKYPTLPVLNRVATSDYSIPGTTDRIEKGTAVMIPVLALQYDPQYFPNPEKFDPDRFSDERKHNLVPYTYLPFGDGPRNCLGVRFGKMQVKVALVTFLVNFSFSLNQKTDVPILFDPKSFPLTVKDDVWLDVRKLDGKPKC